jgi:hypothetical protein
MVNISVITFISRDKIGFGTDDPERVSKATRRA